MQNDYSKKTAAELHYIIRDAGQAAEAMRGLDATAEAKYLDQVNDACTELNRRERKAQKVSRVSRDRIARDLGLVKVRGALGGLYYE